MTAEIKSTTHGRTMVLTLSNPEHRNALAPQMYAAGVEALSVAESSADVRTVVITGEGATFSAGGNLQRLQANRNEPPEVHAQTSATANGRRRMLWSSAARVLPFTDFPFRNSSAHSRAHLRYDGAPSA